MGMKKFRVYGLGQCALDYLGRIKTYPEADSKCEFTSLRIQGGGPVATALVALQRWGISTAFCGVVGDDDFGKQILTELRSEKIDLEDVLIRKNESSQFAFVVAETEPDRRTIFWRRPTGSEPTTTEIKTRRILSAELLHTDGIFPEATLHACKVANSANIPVSVDAGSMREAMPEIASYSDFFLASSTFATQFLGRDDPGIACEKMAGLGARVVCVTLGAQGYVAKWNNKTIERPAYIVDTVDTTGCGDLFHAGFIYGILQEWSIEKSFDYAAWAAAMVSRNLGGRLTIPNVSDYT